MCGFWWHDWFDATILSRRILLMTFDERTQKRRKKIIFHADTPIPHSPSPPTSLLILNPTENTPTYLPSAFSSFFGVIHRERRTKRHAFPPFVSYHPAAQRLRREKTVYCNPSTRVPVPALPRRRPNAKGERTAYGNQGPRVPGYTVTRCLPHSPSLKR